MTRPGALAALPLLAVLLTGCSDDAESAAVPSPSASPTPGEGTSDCATSLVATYPEQGEVPLDVSAEAVALGEGAAYTLYVGDYVIPVEGIAVETRIPPAGEHLVAVFLTEFNSTDVPPPIEAGTTVAWTDETDVLTFSTIFYEGEQPWSAAVDASGELTVVAVSEESICVDVEYRDAEKSLSGRIAAPVHDSPF